MENVVFGLVTGSILLLATVGFSMTRRVENFLNIAYGQYLTIGGYLAWGLTRAGLDILPAAFVALVGTVVLGLLFAKYVFQPIRSYGPLMLLFTSVGVAYLIHGGIEAIWGVGPKTFKLPPPQMISIGGQPLINSTEILIILVAALGAVTLHFALTKTKIGKAIRAMSSNYDLARIRGINTASMSLWTWGIVSALAALSGILTGINAVLYTDMGWAQILLILSAAVLGGLGGSIYGVMIGALGVGLAMDLSVLVLPAAYRSAVAFAVVIIVLFIRPQGILGGRS